MSRKMILPTVLAFSVVSLPSFAATEISSEDTTKYVHIGDISVSGDFFSSNDVIAAIKMKAEENNADYFYISRFTRGNRGFGTNAVLYKEK